MIDSLQIRNYRNLKELRIESLARINLITGKNNVGKSSLLEAIAIFVSNGDLSVLYNLLDGRGENYKRHADSDIDFSEINIKTLSSLFSDRKFSFDKDNVISIGVIDDQILKLGNSGRSILIRFVRYIEDILTSVDEKGERKLIGVNKVIINESKKNKFPDFQIGLMVVNDDDNSFIVSLEKERWQSKFMVGTEENNLQFIRTFTLDRENNGILWDAITLTPKESAVIDALRIVEPNIEKIAFIEEIPGQRSAILKIKNSDTLLPLRSMGDGINRIFTIILALVNCDKGYLLIDEFENGLHYSVQEKLWEVIFKLSETLNIQVFATTHSEDCIRGFESILSSPRHSNVGKLIRLDYHKGLITEIEFDARDLRIATEQNIEIR